MNKLKVLFPYTVSSARSQMAEAGIDIGNQLSISVRDQIKGRLKRQIAETLE